MDGLAAYTLVLGLVMGGGAYHWWGTAQYDLAKVKHAAEVKELKQEIARARAQVARLVGTEPHGVKSITEADCLPTSAGKMPDAGGSTLWG